MFPEDKNSCKKDSSNSASVSEKILLKDKKSGILYFC